MIALHCLYVSVRLLLHSLVAIQLIHSLFELFRLFVCNCLRYRDALIVPLRIPVLTSCLMYTISLVNKIPHPFIIIIPLTAISHERQGSLFPALRFV